METSAPPIAPKLALDFNNTAAAFRHRSDKQLARSLFLFQAFQIKPLVKYGPALARWSLDIGLPVRGLMRELFFKQFCGAYTLEGTVELGQSLAKRNVKTVLDYGVEARRTDEGFEACKAEILRQLEHASHHREVAFVALKATGLCSADVLERVQAGATNSMISKQHKHLAERLEAICVKAAEVGIPVLIDAEESWIQEPIDRLAEDLMARYNRERPLVFTTVQLYRQDRLAYLKQLHARGFEKGFKPGVKLVRGAYIEKEAERATRMGYANPLFPSKGLVDVAYDEGARYCLEHLEDFGLFAGTHNEQSCLKIAQWMTANGIAPNHPNVYFSQLYGMGDHITFNLAEAGFNVGKYLPYGPLDDVLPYLFRRAQENSSIQGQSSRELTLLQKEVRRRRKAG
jgi:proline dehydrogenase